MPQAQPVAAPPARVRVGRLLVAEQRLVERGLRVLRPASVDHLEHDAVGAIGLLLESHVHVHAGVGSGAAVLVRVGDEVAENPVEARLGWQSRVGVRQGVRVGGRGEGWG